MRKLFSLFIALLATNALWAYDFQSGDLYYNITSDTTVEITYRYDYVDMAGMNYDFTTITIPQTISFEDKTYRVNSIGYRAFNTSRNLQAITIPQNILNIGEDAFEDCVFLKDSFVNNSSLNAVANDYWGAKIADSNGLVIKNDTVIDCLGYLTTITIPDGVTCIGGYAFESCLALRSVTIPNSVTTIEYDAFAACISLTSINIPESVTNIEDEAFYFCLSLSSINIPNSVKSIGDWAFYFCPSLLSITIPNSVKSIGDWAFRQNFFLEGNFINNSLLNEKDNDYWGAEFADEEREGLLIRNDTIIGCRRHVTSVTIPMGVRCIRYEAFYFFKTLLSVTMPESVETIDEYAFWHCSSLDSITIPASVSNIKECAFYLCDSLRCITCKALEVPKTGEYVFYGLPLSEATLYVPAESIEKYKSADQWKDFGTILPIEELPAAVENTHNSLSTTYPKKLLRNGQLIILRDGVEYNAMGVRL